MYLKIENVFYITTSYWVVLEKVEFIQLKVHVSVRYNWYTILLSMNLVFNTHHDTMRYKPDFIVHSGGWRIFIC